MRKRDLGLIAVAGGLMVLLLNPFQGKPKKTSNSDRHRRFSETLARGELRETVEKGCVSCHSIATTPLPPKHPPKGQCLICHPFQQAH